MKLIIFFQNILNRFKKPKTEEYDFMDEYLKNIYPEIKTWVKEKDFVSYNQIQKHFQIGYAITGRIMNALEKNKIIGPQIGRSIKHKVL